MNSTEQSDEEKRLLEVRVACRQQAGEAPERPADAFAAAQRNATVRAGSGLVEQQRRFAERRR